MAKKFIGLLVALLLVLAFFLSKTLLIAFETTGGMVIGVRFKKGVIESAPVGIEQACFLIDLAAILAGCRCLTQQVDGADLVTVIVARERLVCSQRRLTQPLHVLQSLAADQ